MHPVKISFFLSISLLTSLVYLDGSHKSFDSSMPDFIDILDGKTKINESSIKCEISLKHLDPVLKFDNSNLNDNALEYQWGVFFDNDSDGNYDIAFAISNFKQPDEFTQNGRIKDFTQSDIWKISDDITSRIDFIHSTIEGNKIILETLRWHKELNNISTHSTVKYKSYYNDGTTIFTDSLVVNGLNNN